MSFFDDILGNTGADAARQAAGAQVAGLEDARGQISKGTKKAIGFLRPYEQTGQGANTLLADALGINGPEKQAAYYAQFQNDPGFLATRDAGIEGINQNRATGGLLHSGGTLKALQDFGQRLMQSQFQDRLRGLTSQAGQGFNAATNQGNFQMRGSESIARLLGQMGDAQAGGILGAAQAQAAGSQNLLGLGTGLATAGLKAFSGGFPLSIRA